MKNVFAVFIVIALFCGCTNAQQNIVENNSKNSFNLLEDSANLLDSSVSSSTDLSTVEESTVWKFTQTIITNISEKQSELSYTSDKLFYQFYDINGDGELELITAIYNYNLSDIYIFTLQQGKIVLLGGLKNEYLPILNKVYLDIYRSQNSTIIKSIYTYDSGVDGILVTTDFFLEQNDNLNLIYSASYRKDNVTNEILYYDIWNCTDDNIMFISEQEYEQNIVNVLIGYEYYDQVIINHSVSNYQKEHVLYQALLENYLNAKNY